MYTVKEFAKKAKDKKLQPADWEGSTFTISNLGMFGIDSFTAIINPPDACILAVGGIAQEPVVKNGQIVPGNVMNVTLSCDHRVVDGATGSAFLQTLKKLIRRTIKNVSVIKKRLRKFKPFFIIKTIMIFSRDPIKSPSNKFVKPLFINLMILKKPHRKSVRLFAGLNNMINLNHIQLVHLEE